MAPEIGPKSFGAFKKRTPGVEPGPHRWKASGLTSATALLPKRGYCVDYPINIMGDELLLYFGAKFRR